MGGGHVKYGVPLLSMFIKGAVNALNDQVSRCVVKLYLTILITKRDTILIAVLDTYIGL